MPDYRLVKQAGEGYRQQMLHAVTDRFEVSYGAFNGTLARVARRYDFYRGIFTGRYHSHRNNVHIPFIFSVIQSDVAKKMNTIFGSWPYVRFYGDPTISRRNDVLISEQFDEADSFRKGVDFCLQADLYGVGVLQHGWKTKTDRRRFRETLSDPFTQDLVQQVVEEDVVEYDGPDWHVIDVLDCFPQPGVPRIKDMRWFIRRYWLDYDDLRALAKAGIYDADEVERVKDSHFRQERTLGYAERRYLYRNWLDSSEKGQDKLERPVEIMEMWGTLPDELVPADGQKSRVITVGNGIALLRNDPNPFWHGQIPFLDYAPLQDPHFFHAPSKVEIAERPQAAANRIANQQLDAIDLTIDPSWIVNRNIGLDVRNLFMRTGRTFQVDGPDTDADLRPLVPDLRGINLGYGEIAQLQEWIERGVGMFDDTLMGGALSKRQTRGEYLGRQAAASDRLLLEARLAEEAWIEPMAHFFRALNQQFLSLPKELLLSRDRAFGNPVTGEMEFPEEIEPEDLNTHLKKCRARGATQQMGKDQRVANMFQFMQMAGTNPAAAVAVNWVNFLRYTTIEMDLPADEILADPETQLLNAMSMGVLDGNQGMGQEKPGTGPVGRSLAEVPG